MSVVKINIIAINVWWPPPVLQTGSKGKCTVSCNVGDLTFLFSWCLSFSGSSRPGLAHPQRTFCQPSERALPGRRMWHEILLFKGGERANKSLDTVFVISCQAQAQRRYLICHQDYKWCCFREREGGVCGKTHLSWNFDAKRVLPDTLLIWSRSQNRQSKDLLTSHTVQNKLNFCESRSSIHVKHHRNTFLWPVTKFANILLSVKVVFGSLSTLLTKL